MHRRINSRLIQVIYVLITLLITFFTYESSLNNGFTNWDDPKYVIDNELIKSFSWNNIKAIFSTYIMGNYHPFAIISYAFDYYFYQLDPFGYHLTNLIIHLVNTALVFVFIKTLIKKSELALVVSLLFGIHPLHIESVVWISERKDLLYILFYLASLIGYLKYISSPSKGWGYLIFTFTMFVFSLLSKGQAVTLPLCLLLIDYFKSRQRIKSVIIEKVPFFLLSLIFGVIAILAQDSSGAMLDIEDYSYFERVLFGSYAFLMYCWKCLFPLNLSAFHPYPVKVEGWYPIAFYFSPFIIVALLYLFIRFSKRIPEVIFGLSFFCINIFLLLQFIPVGEAMYAERYTYLANIGLYFIIGSLIYKALNKTIIKTTLTVLLVLFVLINIKTSKERIAVWKNSKTLWGNVLAQYPYVPGAYNNIGDYYMQKDQWGLAIKNYNRSTELKPDYAEVYYNKGIAYDKLNKDSKAIENHTQAIKIKPDYADAYNNRGLLYLKVKKHDQALADFDMAIKIKPDFADYYYNKGLVLYNIKNYKEAIENYNTAINLKSDYAEAYNNRGLVYYELKRFDDAISDYSFAVKLKPDFASAYNNRGVAHYNLKKLNLCLEDFNKAIEADYGFSYAYKNRGITKEIRGDSFCEDYKKACELGLKECCNYYLNKCNNKPK